MDDYFSFLQELSIALKIPQEEIPPDSEDWQKIILNKIRRN